MNNETHVMVRDLLSRWLADPARDLESAVLWCERYLAKLPYSLIDASSEDIARQAAGSYRASHRAKLAPFVRALTGRGVRQEP